MKLGNHIIHLFRAYHPRDITIGISFRCWGDGYMYFELEFLMWRWVFQMYRRQDANNRTSKSNRKTN